MHHKNQLLFFIFSFILFNLAFAKEPLNLSAAKQNVIKYYTSGEYNQDVAKKAEQAKKFLQSKLAVKNNSKKLAIVFDIDDTLVSSFDLNKENGFSDSHAAIQIVLATVHKEPIQPMLDLYNFAKQNGVTIFLVSNRQENLRKKTTDLLVKNGYTEWKGLFLQPTDSSAENKINFKQNIRKFIDNSNYDIVLNIGDQSTDLIGEYADKTIKLPNPCYTVQNLT